MRLPVNRRSSGPSRSARKFFFYCTTILFTVLLAACAEQTEPDASPASAANSTPSGTAITNITVIDGVNGVRANQTVLFDGDQITAVQDAALAVDAQEIIDGSGKFLIPGLWDFHVHLTYDPRLTAAMSDLFLSYGITSVRDTGGLLENVLPVIATMREEGAVAPRVFFAGPLLDGEHVVYDGVGRPEIGVQNVSVEQARERVAELRNQGASFIKVYEMVSPAVFDALVAAANELGMPIDSHVPLSLRARDAGAVVSSIEHLRNIEMDCAANAEELHATRLQLLENPDAIAGADLRASLHSLQRLPAVADYSEAECDAVIAALANTVMVPTLRLNSFNLAPVWQRDDFDDALERLPVDVRDEWRAQAATRSAQPTGDTRFAEWSLFLTERMHNAGVPFGAGTDTPINLSVPGYSLHSELEMLVRAGLSPLEALSAATLEPAKFFSLESEMGTIEAGKVADLVLLDADPLISISNTKRINLVVSKGQIVGRD